MSFEIGIMDLKSNKIGIFHPCKFGLRDFTQFEIRIMGLQWFWNWDYGITGPLLWGPYYLRWYLTLNTTTVMNLGTTSKVQCLRKRKLLSKGGGGGVGSHVILFDKSQRRWFFLNNSMQLLKDLNRKHIFLRFKHKFKFLVLNHELSFVWYSQSSRFIAVD